MATVLSTTFVDPNGAVNYATTLVHKEREHDV